MSPIRTVANLLEGIVGPIQLVLLVLTILIVVVGVMMGIGGLGWLTFSLPSLARELAPYNYLPGIVGETMLTVWLLFTGARVARRAGSHAVRVP